MNETDIACPCCKREPKDCACPWDKPFEHWPSYLLAKLKLVLGRS